MKTEEGKLRDRVRAKKRYWSMRDDPEFRAKIKKATQEWQERHPERYILSQAKARAKKNKISFNIEETDIVIPEFCPILNIPLSIGGNTAHGGSPTLDRIIPELGYIKGNVQIISLKANLMKSSATPSELALFAKWIFNKQNISLDTLLV